MKGIGRIICPLVAVLLFVTACNSGPKVIPEKKMQAIFQDLLVADQWTYSNEEFAMQADTTLFYQAVFDKYGYDSDDFKASIDYYMKDPSRLSRMLKKIAIDLESRSNTLREAQEQPVLMENNE